MCARLPTAHVAELFGLHWSMVRTIAKYGREILGRVRVDAANQLRHDKPVKVIKRIAYGYRDSEYFVLKIKAAFPGNP